MSSTVMRPGNFRHDMRGPRVVEISMEEYLRSKQSILKKIRRRLMIIGMTIVLLAFIAFILGAVVSTEHKRVTKFQRKTINLSLGNLYFVYGGGATALSFHGFYLDGHWRKMQEDGNRLVMHLRLYGLLGVASCILAIWLGYATLASFGLVDVRDVTSSSVHIIYLVTLIIVCIHLVVTPWLLRTIHRKASQADEYFGAEFMDNMRHRGRRAKDDEDENDDNESDDDERTVVHPAMVSPRLQRNQDNGAYLSPGASPTRNRRAFFNADGSATVTSPTSARTPARQPAPTSPRSTRSPRNDHRHVDPRNMHIPAIASDHLVSASDVTDPDAIPFASPVFMVDTPSPMDVTNFWRLWKHTETTGSFSCLFRNHPLCQDVESHLLTNGFHVVAVEAKETVLQVYFSAQHFSTGSYFLCEFVFIYSRRFFQATFKCQAREEASEFVTRFNLQELLTVEE